MKLLLLHSPGWDPAPIAEPLATDQIECRALGTAAELPGDERPTVFLLAAADRAAFPLPRLERLFEAGTAIVALGGEGERDLPEKFPADRLAAFLPTPAAPRHLLLTLRAAFRTAVARREAARARDEIAARMRELTELTDIGMRLTTEKHYDALLELILGQALGITHADAGSLYIVEADEQGGRRLRFKLSQNQSRPDIPFVEFTIPIDHASLAGYAATEGEPLVIDDVYMLPGDVAYSFNRSFDERYGYRTKSMLVIPMQNHQGDVIGVLQLINRKRDRDAVLTDPAEATRQVVAFSPHTVKLVKALAGQAAVSIENSQLYESIERLFEGFVLAAVTAIEQRDPTTSGHSERVAAMSVGLAVTVDRARDGLYAPVAFSPEQVRELRYASLLHDFGKVGVREQVLVKANKLYPADLDLIRERHAFILRSAQWRYERGRADFLATHGPGPEYTRHLAALDAELAAEEARLQRFLQVVEESNRPSILAEGTFEALLEFAERSYVTMAGEARPYLTPDEIRFLSIRKGSLDERERVEIESHVTHTFGFLRKIPWTRELSQIPAIAHGHHEKLDGTGYPRKIRGTEIPVQTRIMTIADIFDALTAQDRPYKRALPTTRALDILTEEVKAGMLDPELFRLFVEDRVYEQQRV